MSQPASAASAASSASVHSRSTFSTSANLSGEETIVDDRARARVAPGVLAGHVDVEVVHVVLHGRDAHAPGGQLADELLDEGGLAGVALPDEGDDGNGHGLSVTGVYAPCPRVDAADGRTC